MLCELQLLGRHDTRATTTAAARASHQWAEVKEAASEAISRNGATITHHHAVGRVHRPWYERERPLLMEAALRAVKRTFDPAGLLNPGVLFDP